MTARVMLLYDNRLDPCPRCGAWKWEYRKVHVLDGEPMGYGGVACRECNAEYSIVELRVGHSALVGQD